MRKYIPAVLATAFLILPLAFSCGSKDDTGEVGVEKESHFITDTVMLRLCLDHHDLDGDGRFTKEEAAQVDTLILNNGRAFIVNDDVEIHLNVHSLEGIEYFTSLKYLDCSENFITDIDLSANSRMQVLNANYNPLKTVDVTGCPLLEKLGCTPRDIVSGGIAVGKQPGQIESLDFSNNPLLKSLNLNYLGLTELNIGKNPNLTDLYIQSNSIGNLDLSHCTGLEQLYAWNAGIKNLKLPPAGKLVRLDIADNNISEIDLHGQSALVHISCTGNPLTSVDISECSSLSSFNFIEGGLTALNASGLKKLRILNCQGNKLTMLDISGCEELWTLNCEDNLLTSLDTDGFEKLETIWCRNNDLDGLDLRSNTKLSNLYAKGNPLTGKVRITSGIFSNLHTDIGSAYFIIE